MKLVRACASCQHFKRDRTTDGNTMDAPAQGECRRHAPRPLQEGELWRWPVVTLDEFCGEWRQRQ